MERVPCARREPEKLLLPENPAGLVELDDAELSRVEGGMYKATVNHCSFAGQCPYSEY